MTSGQQLIVLRFQIAASALMGLDYFMPESWRRKANENARQYLSDAQSRVDADIVSAWQYIKSKAIAIAIAVAILAFAFLMFKLAKLPIIAARPISLALWIIASSMLFLGGFGLILNIVTDILVPVGLGGLFRIITTFILGSPKGPLAAIGFICLCISFALRYNFLGNM